MDSGPEFSLFPGLEYLISYWARFFWSGFNVSMLPQYQLALMNL